MKTLKILLAGLMMIGLVGCAQTQTPEETAQEEVTEEAAEVEETAVEETTAVEEEVKPEYDTMYFIGCVLSDDSEELNAKLDEFATAMEESGHFFEYITGSASIEDDMISLAGTGNNVIFVQVPEGDTTLKKQAKALAQEGIVICMFTELNEEVTFDTLFNACNGSLSDDEINTLGLTLIK